LFRLGLKQGLNFQEVARVEARRSDFPGLFIQTDVGRAYPFGKVGAHVIGYLGKMTPAQASSAEFSSLPPETPIGQWGIEALYDKQLRGVAGGKVIEVDALGREHRLIQEKPAVKGNGCCPEHRYWHAEKLWKMLSETRPARSSL